jgi:two-component system chemotaxis response regulator CheY
MSKARILVIEDSPAMRQLMGRALDRMPQVEGWDEAADGAEALKMLASGTHALAIVDLNLPVLDGLKLIERIRGRPGGDTVKIIVVTTDAAEADRKRAMDLGADAYLLKPIQIHDLREAITKALSHPEPARGGEA